MRAARITTLDGPSSVLVTDVEEPDGAGDRVVIDVHAAGVTFPDVLQTRGLYQYRPELPFVPGTEVAGIVRSAPSGAPVRVGDRVAAFPGLGGFAETVAVPGDAVFGIPDTLSFAAAAALPMNYLTVHFALTRRGGLREGETVLVHGAGGGVGTAAVQLASALGARIIAVTSSPEKAETARGAGAHHVVSPGDFRADVLELTGGAGVDVVVDPVGGDRFTDSLRCLAPEGRLLVIGFTAGEIPTVKVNRLLLNNISVVGVGWGAFWARRPDYLRRQWAELRPLVEDGVLDPPIGATYPLDDVATALSELDTRSAKGKIVLTLR
ncbi:NADPH:quinone oxidoreductase family protein [Saccharomonospora xinjiangensis]|uniref:Zn-dependent oxidoreductase, NADPH:quinone reductase n=1 Tax=Saccharomonospora xinjiangensis XJ-54 TaxID=882086 RepID=I0V7F7_9PSEU|nr:NADPH:quinone oxidoreductase family protein [Saccharomonospora xinjiangensis]EID56060.1 Zn-dependent oxidoreductase, NADPH:quinone reductase [Saccharomonospora xinjiangensis XJ-54]